MGIAVGVFVRVVICTIIVLLVQEGTPQMGINTRYSSRGGDASFVRSGKLRRDLAQWFYYIEYIDVSFLEKSE